MAGVKSGELTRKAYEESANTLALYSRFVVGSAIGHKFVRFGDDKFHYVPIPKDEQLTAEDVAAVDALLSTDDMPASYLGELSREDAAELYTRHYIKHSDLRTAMEQSEQ